jgi:beta-lactamase class C
MMSAAVAVRARGRTLFFNYGFADLKHRQPITTDSLFNLASVRKLFEADLLALAAKRGELDLDDPVAKYVAELEDGGDIKQVTIGQLATYTSGLVLPQDHPPWGNEHYALAEFIDVLKAWKADKNHAPGKQHIYSHAGYVVLQLALERRFQEPIAALLEERLIAPLGLTSTLVPIRGSDGRAGMAPELMARAVQGYGEDDEPVGLPGDQQSFYDFPGTGQMFSSARDLAIYAAAHLGELPIDHTLQEAMHFAHQPHVAPAGGDALRTSAPLRHEPARRPGPRLGGPHRVPSDDR